MTELKRALIINLIMYWQWILLILLVVVFLLMYKYS